MVKFWAIVLLEKSKLAETKDNSPKQVTVLIEAFKGLTAF